jgi:hypothetical protein
MMRQALRGPRRWFFGVIRGVVDAAVYQLSKPIKKYNPGEVTNLASLVRRIRKGDVLLVCGNARISYVVKVLTISPWSHVALYVGDRRDLLKPEEIEEWRRQFGDRALEHLVIDADPVKGVHLKPLDDYAGLMIRHCRAEALSREDIDKVVQFALSQLGKRYDIKHILRLSLFFAFPWELLPEAIRRFVTDFTLSETYQICSRVLSEAFESVGYPIRPVEIVQKRSELHTRTLGLAFGLKSRSRSAARLLAGGRLKKALNRLTDARYTEVRLKSHRYITPADYDLSRFFSVIKDPADLNFDYRSAKLLHEAD